eukprot:gnl/Dysnectes_brevis/6744_a10695_219.p1 GENE.gnl/Dysnectes_brevis/6744_a10695_219~~gnl/Dysnectes_brevis/6744_a10695_219.p1  ORF type:complete len:363 (+),score=61.72 gnl/Dysnectes_brevis/6744_a10695_219:50-1138(+)
MRICPGTFKKFFTYDPTNSGIKARDLKPFASIESFNFRTIDVPLFQRKYCWNETLLSVFLNDLNQSLTFSSHNIGKIIICSDNAMHGIKEDCPEHTIVIDGQQRLTTSTLLLIALRDWYAAHTEVEHHRQHVIDINSLLFRHSSPLTVSSSHPWSHTGTGPHGQWRGERGEILSHPAALFRPSHDDRLTYFTLLLGHSCATTGRDIIRDAKAFFDAALLSHPSIHRVRHNLLHRMQFMVHELTEGDPQAAFMSEYTTGEAVKIMFTITRFGVSLAQSDLVRNMLMMELPLPLAERLYFDLWLPIEESRTPGEIGLLLYAFLPAGEAAGGGHGRLSAWPRQRVQSRPDLLGDRPAGRTWSRGE